MKTHLSDLFRRPFAAPARILNRRQPRKRSKKTLFPLFAPVLLIGLGLLPAGRLTAQTFTTLYSFTATSTNSSGVYTNSDGANPGAGLITDSSGNRLYGTAYYGGSSGNGTVFALNTDGTGFTNLYYFTATGTNSSGVYTNTEGANPVSGLVLWGNTLYGTAVHGGDSGKGTVFKVNTDGTSFANLHSFTAIDPVSGSNSDGALPHSGLTLSGNTLYGTAFQGGTSGQGTVFAVNTDGTGFTNLHSFLGYPSDGSGPDSGLILSGNTLYGTTFVGGSLGYGTVFAVNTDGTGITNLHSFNPSSDGFHPAAGLILSGNTLYGTASEGGIFDVGTVFALNTDGTGFTNLHSFSEGAFPYAGLILSGGTLYGTTAGNGGTAGYGTVFAVNTNGTGFTNLHRFTPQLSGINSDGANPFGGVTLSGNTLYGTASAGGSSGNGTVFSISFRPQLTITPSGTNVILSWPTNVVGFDYTGYILQSTTNLLSPAAWITNSLAPIVVNGQNTATNPISGAQQFYRLIQ